MSAEPKSGEAALLKIIEFCGPQFTMADVLRFGLSRELRAAVRAGFIRGGYYETTAKADDWLIDRALAEKEKP